MTKLRTLFVVVAVCLFASASFAATFDVVSDGNDQTWRDDGSSLWVGQRRADVGMDSGKRELAHVLVFELPDIGDESIVSANLLMHAWTSAYGYGFGIDLYGLRWSSANATTAADFYAGPLDTASTLIMEDFSGKIAGNPAAVNERNEETDAAGDAALAAWLSSLYADGASAGDYAILRVNPDNADISNDGASSTNTYVYFDSGNTTTVQSGGATYVQVPVLTIETAIPEPASFALLSLGSFMLIRRH